MSKDAAREAHRLRPLSEWKEADGYVLLYFRRGQEWASPGVGRGAPADVGFTHWLPLPDLELLWVR